MIYLSVPSLNRYDLLDKCLLSAENGNLKPNKYLIMDNGGSYNSNILSEKKEVLNFNANLGCAKSWNHFLQNYKGIHIISNDDIEFLPDTIEKMIKCYNEQKDNRLAGIFFPSGQMGSAFSCFILSENCIKEVGYFDENFYPAYFEDNDYTYRANIAGITGFVVPECNYNHAKSSTLLAYNSKQKENHQITFEKNRQYYIDKWGGSVGQEKYKTPFNK